MSLGLLVPSGGGDATRVALAERAAHALRADSGAEFAALATAARRYADCAAPSAALQWHFGGAPLRVGDAASEPFAVSVPPDCERVAALFLAAAAAARAGAIGDALTHTARAAECAHARDKTLPPGVTGRAFVCAPHFYEQCVAPLLFAALLCGERAESDVLSALRGAERARLLEDAARHAPYNVCPRPLRAALHGAARDVRAAALRCAARALFDRATATQDDQLFGAADALCVGAVREARSAAVREAAEVDRDAHRSVCNALGVATRFFCAGRTPRIEARHADGRELRAPALARMSAADANRASLGYDAAAVTLRVRCDAATMSNV